MIGLRRLIRRPVYGVLLLALAGGLISFRDYGLTWDEPLFYKYADALGYAYTPANWLGGHFDLNQSYGPSGDDHKSRGPGYLLLAREPVYLLESLGLDGIGTWHLVNFLTYVLGIYFLYRLCCRFVHEAAAVVTAAFFAAQPLLWGHAFINPKDMPFLVFVLGAVWLGFRMVDRLEAREAEPTAITALNVLPPAALLGIASANRVLGPLAGVLVLAYFIGRGPSRRGAAWILLYVIVAVAIIFAAWPYLWESPLRFMDVFKLMSDNPTNLQVLFADHVYRAFELPRRYLPFFLMAQLTEPVWPLFVVGLVVAGLRIRGNARLSLQGILILAWFAIPVAYVVLARPPLYDGMRHFLFIIPPIFIFAGIAVDFIFGQIHRLPINALLAALLLLPGLTGILRLHPYEYAYFNGFVGGTGGVFRHYETDYWLTCYKEAVERFNSTLQSPVRLFVHREPAVAAPFAAANVAVLDERGAARSIHSGDYVLVSTRTNEDRQTYHDAPALLSVGRVGATFCVIKSIP
jgi:hypothetical protein